MAQYVIFNIDSLMKHPQKHPQHSAHLITLYKLANCALLHADIVQLKLHHISHKPSRIENVSTHSDILLMLTNNSEAEQLFANLKVNIYAQSTLMGEFVTPQQYLTPPQRLLMRQLSKQIMFTIAEPQQNYDRIQILPFC